MPDTPEQPENHPGSALEEVLREIEEAERRTTDHHHDDHDGEAAEAITPNPRAQEDSREKSEGGPRGRATE
ncbi:hypothetical protein [Streptomyces sp. A012304]|uniref:hypothetical protein n=1 Tax=Streptomyces sp. A012304 TaxID=375446 RepID=UPI00222FE2C7|nr:hypothetical protein [Streptomyces sp. A012304]